jgi:hypothetical protein
LLHVPTLAALKGNTAMPELAKRPRYQVGDKLQLKDGPRWIGTVTDAYGTFSPTGNILYRVRVPLDPEPLYMVLTEDEVEKV